MLRRVLLPLRTWSGMLLVCALFACLSGLARPAMAMPMEMPAHVTASGHAGHAVAPAVADSPVHSPRCPAAEEQCVAPKATLAQDGPSGQMPAVSPGAMACSPTLLVAQPHAPPRTAAPPDLHELCVSRT